MRTRTSTCGFLAQAALLLALAAGCATHAPDINGHWKAVNRYAETTEEIPLERPYVFSPSPLDGTLKTMLMRWAKDSNRSLSYQHPSDFTLYAPVAQVRTKSIEEAASLLTAIYAKQGVSITATKDRLVARATASTAASTPSGANAP